MQDLHPAVRGRVEKLRDLQESYDRLEDEYLEEQRKLVLKYEALYTPLYEQRREIVNGKKDAEIEPVHMEGDDENEGSSSGEGGQGIPEFWACCIRANDVVSELITAKDDEVLKHLKDIRYELLGTPEGGEDKGDEEEEEEGLGNDPRASLSLSHLLRVVCVEAQLLQPVRDLLLIELRVGGHGLASSASSAGSGSGAARQPLALDPDG